MPKRAANARGARAVPSEAYDRAETEELPSALYEESHKELQRQLDTDAGLEADDRASDVLPRRDAEPAAKA